MQTMMIQSLQAPARPVAGKTSAAKGSGLFEELLGDNPRPSTKTPQGTDPFELLAAAMTFGWPPVPTLTEGAGVVNAAELAAAIAAVAADSAPASAGLPLLADLVQGQDLGLESPAAPAQQLGTAARPTAESAPELLSGKLPSVIFQTEAPAAPMVREGGAPTPTLMPAEEALAPVQPLPEKAAQTGGIRPEIELLGGQKKFIETSSSAREAMFTEAADEEPATEGSAKAAGPSEARFSEMLQGAVKSAPLHSAQRGDPPRGELSPELKATPAKEMFAVAADSLGAAQEPAAAPATPASSLANGPHVAAVTAPAQPPVAAVPAPPVAALQLPSGQIVAENELLGQVLGRLQVGVRRESSSISMKLHPEELGEVKLDLLVEKDRVKALIVTQNQQVQEVLERHLPRLREALQQQGLKLESFQVSVDSQQQDNSRGFSQHEQRTATAAHNGGRRGVGRPDGERAEQPQMLSTPAQSGLSIRI